jgi:hypothetical protein
VAHRTDRATHPSTASWATPYTAVTTISATTTDPRPADTKIQRRRYPTPVSRLVPSSALGRSSTVAGIAVVDAP